MTQHRVAQQQSINIQWPTGTFLLAHRRVLFIVSNYDLERQKLPVQPYGLAVNMSGHAQMRTLNAVCCRAILKVSLSFFVCISL